MKRILFFFLMLSGWLRCEAQYFNQTSKYIKANSVWVFGRGAGFNFNTNAAFQTPILSEEGSASVASRTTGGMLFSSDGRSVWNKNLGIMTQANGSLLGNNILNGTTAQGVCIVPFINDTSKYYLFSLQPQGGNALATQSKGKLYYSVVDMTLSGGNGNVVTTQKNILVDSFIGEAMMAVPGNNCDIWLIVHKINVPVFKAYHITASGFDPNPVISTAGTQISGANTYVQTFGSTNVYSNYDAYAVGNMAVSPDRSKIGITSEPLSFGTLFLYQSLTKGAMICDFDAGTGQVSNGLLVDTNHCYGVAFSPDNLKFYISSGITGSWALAQYNLTIYNAPAIIASKTILNYTGSSHNMRLYNDTIYVAYGGSSSTTPFVHRINNPNLTGLAANLQLNAITLAPNTSCNFNLPSPVVYPNPPDTIGHSRLDTTLCESIWSTMQLDADAGYTSYLWDNGTTGTSRTVTQSGTYWVFCKDACHSVIDSFYIHAAPPDTTGIVTLDTLICETFNNIGLNAPSGYLAYIWNDGSISDTRNINDWGTYWVLCKDSCHVRVDTFHINGADVAFNLGNDTNICNYPELFLKVNVDDASYLWQDGATGQSYNVTSTGPYSVTVSKNGCTAADLINVNFINLKQELGNDTIVCYGNPFTMVLTAQAPDGSAVAWSNGATDRTIAVRDTGYYSVIVSQEQCSGTDTVHIDYVLCECSYGMPTAFTPNGDDVNDVFKPSLQPNCTTSRYALNIYNRFGQRIFIGYKPEEGWDGTFNGQLCDLGTYYYELSFEGGSRKIQYYQKGDITLIR